MSEDKIDIEIRVLGALAVVVDEKELPLTPVERNLVALLAAAGPSGLETEQLADQLWPAELPNTWRASFRNNVSRLNKKVAAANPEGAKLISERSVQRKLLVETRAVDLWRLRAWAANLAGAEGDPVETEPSLLAGSPFPGCELSPLLQDVVHVVTAARRDIIAFWAKDGERLSHSLLVSLRQLCLEDPYNVSLAEVVVQLHISATAPDLALELIEDLSIEAPLPAGLVELRRSLLDNRRPADLDMIDRPVTFPIHSPIIDQLAHDPLSGREEMLKELLAATDSRGTGLLIHGEGGIGKTRLAVEVAACLGNAGFHTAYVVADRQLFGTLQPFVDSFPDIGERLRPHLDSLNDLDSQARCRQEIRSFLADRFAGHPLCLVIDDAHWLDDQSSGLVMSLARAGLPEGLIIIAVGRSGVRDARWAAWLSDLARARLQQFKVRSLNRDGMVDLIRSTRTGLSHLGTQSLADQLLELSSGIPGVARWLLDRADTSSLSIKIDDVVGTGYAAMVNDLTEPRRRCGAAASVLGRKFDIDDLDRLLDNDPRRAEQLTEDLEELVNVGLLVELSVPGTYRFAHVLAAEAFNQTLSAQERVGYHAQAFAKFDQPIRRARHAEHAAPIVGEAQAANALIRSARLQFNDGNYSATISDLRAAKKLDNTTIGPDDEIILVESLERSGISARDERSRLVRQAVRDGDTPLALQAATAGLPDTEAFEGDPVRVATMQLVDAQQLSRSQRVHYHVQLCRQLLLLGHVEAAKAEADLAAQAASSADERAEAWLAVRLVAGVGRPMEPGREWPKASELTSESLRLRVSQAATIDAIATGGSRREFDLVEHHAHRASGAGFPQLTWFSQLFLATALTDQGELQAARTAAERAHHLGLQAGLRVAEGTFLTQRFIWELLADNHGALYPMVVGGGPDEIAGNIIFAAALVACHHAYAQNDAERARATERTRSVCNQAMESHFDLAAIGLMADSIAASRNQRLIEWATERLVTRSDVYVLLASAAANLGPGRRLMAKIEPDREVKNDLLEAAIVQADGDKLPLWQVVSRVERADLFDAQDAHHKRLLDEAKELANTPWLQQVIVQRTEDR